MNRAGVIFCVVSIALSLALVMALMPSAMVPASVAADAATCKTLEDDIEVELSGVLEGVSMYDLLSHYLENPPTCRQVQRQGATVRRLLSPRGVELSMKAGSRHFLSTPLVTLIAGLAFLNSHTTLADELIPTVSSLNAPCRCRVRRCGQCHGVP